MTTMTALLTPVAATVLKWILYILSMLGIHFGFNTPSEGVHEATPAPSTEVVAEETVDHNSTPAPAENQNNTDPQDNVPSPAPSTEVTNQDNAPAPADNPDSPVVVPSEGATEETTPVTPAPATEETTPVTPAPATEEEDTPSTEETTPVTPAPATEEEDTPSTEETTPVTPAPETEEETTPSTEETTPVTPAPETEEETTPSTEETTPATPAPEENSDEAILNNMKPAMTDYTNQYRKAHGLSPVTESEDLNNSAQAWANHLAETGAFEHDTMTCNNNRQCMSENIAITGPYQEDPAKNTVDRWYKSPGHKANMLNPDASEIGHGTAYMDKGEWRGNYVEVQRFWNDY